MGSNSSSISDNNNSSNPTMQFIGDQASRAAGLFGGGSKVFADPETAYRSRMILKEKYMLRLSEDESGMERASCDVCNIRLTPLSVDQQWVCTQCGKRTPFDIESLIEKELRREEEEENPDGGISLGIPALRLHIAGKKPPLLKTKSNEKGREPNSAVRMPKSLQDKISKRFYNQDDKELTEQGYTVVRSDTIDPENV